MLTISLLLALLCRCNDPVISNVPPGHGMGVRYTERGLERFCQKGYSIVPDILAQMPPFEIEEIALGGLKISLSNVRVRAVQLATMKMFLQDSGRIKMEGRDGLMQLSMRVGATLNSLSGAADAVFSLHGFGADLSARIGEDPDCPFHFGLFEFANQVYISKLDADVIGLDAVGSVVATVLQTMVPSLESLLRTTILQSMLDTILHSVRDIMLGVPTMSRKGEYRTDQRYVSGINIRGGKVVADLDGYSYICYPGTDTPASERYPVDISSPSPRAVYSSRDYEIYFDREAINSYLHAWQSLRSSYDLSGLSVGYRDLRRAGIPGLAKALVEAGLLAAESDPGSGVTLELSVRLAKAPRVPWLGAAGFPVYFDGIFCITARKDAETRPLAELESAALVLGALGLDSYNAGFTSDRAYGYVVLKGLVELATAKAESSCPELDFDALARYMISAQYIPEANVVLSDPGIILINGNFVDYATAVAVYLPTEDRILFTADIVGNPYFP
ncbi:Hypothetical protein GLP15_5002 [Giardia lamblia P15]|uniref:BPI-like protein n=1 Tax=Giardia intestinalis (strain P15) TaxID=658858 RepID=E1F9U4_GIAIA|nr:Hypothetical protein GLP15_5002 [Giardia lamblia P15]